MPLEQRLEQSQKLILTQSMQQSLHILQLPVQDLRSLLREAALSNPLLDVEEPPLDCPYPEPPERAMRDAAFRDEQMVFGGVGEPTVDFTAFYSRPQSFSEHLSEQLGQMRALDGDTLARCRYLVDCLNPLGYLDCALSELAEEAGQSLFDMEQALFIVQSLDPIGAGARSLSECLLLQLAQGRDFTQTNIRLIQSGLPLLAKNDMVGLGDLLGVRLPEVRRAAEVIRGLNPIPSRGFYTDCGNAYVQPEAVIRCEGGQVLVDMNDRVLPKVTLDPAYCAMIGDGACQDAQPYLREKLAEAKSLLANLQGRYDTLARLLCAVALEQREHFLSGAPLRPMTMRQLAESLDLNTSTVSRAVKDKYIQFQGQVFPLRRLFTAALQTTDGAVTSASAAKQQIRRFIAAEDRAKPLSDMALGEALASVGIVLSRRTVAKYRDELGIPAAGARRQAPP